MLYHLTYYWQCLEHYTCHIPVCIQDTILYSWSILNNNIDLQYSSIHFLTGSDFYILKSKRTSYKHSYRHLFPLLVVFSIDFSSNIHNRLTFNRSSFLGLIFVMFYINCCLYDKCRIYVDYHIYWDCHTYENHQIFCFLGL